MKWSDLCYNFPMKQNKKMRAGVGCPLLCEDVAFCMLSLRWNGPDKRVQVTCKCVNMLCVVFLRRVHFMPVQCGIIIFYAIKPPLRIHMVIMAYCKFVLKNITSAHPNNWRSTASLQHGTAVFYISHISILHSVALSKFTCCQCSNDSNVHKHCK